MRVAVAMSGGLDSSVAAALLLERGYRVEGLTMRLWKEPSATGDDHDVACDARAVCEHLGIRHRTIDLRDVFLREVVDYFVEEYARGRTPNPCLRCNRLLKFGLLLDRAREQGCDWLATGHYARIEREGEAYHLLCGVDSGKDQSYFLYALKNEQLALVLFPLGSHSKREVGAMARAWGLPIAGKPESQDVCFLRDNDYRRFLSQRLGPAVRPGPIYDVQGRCLGEHHGLPFYTVGQREGLGISAPRPLYVVRLDPRRNALVVGHAEELGSSALMAEEMRYVSGREEPADSRVEAQIRYRAKRVPARVWALPNGRARVVFSRALRDIAPGQAVVLYRGQRVLGGGIISRALGIQSRTGNLT